MNKVIRAWIIAGLLAPCSALVYAQEDFSRVEIATERLSTTTYMMIGAGGNLEFLNMRTMPEPKEALPVVTFTTDVTFHLNGDEVYVFHVPRAHTDGDAIVHFRKSNVVHMGDTFFNKLYPFIDTSSGGTIDGMVAAADKGLAIGNDNTRYIPGHGPLASKADLQAYRNMLATIGERIRAQVRAGAKLEDVIATKPTADFDDAWGKGFLPAPRFIEMVYKNLQPR